MDINIYIYIYKHIYKDVLRTTRSLLSQHACICPRSSFGSDPLAMAHPPGVAGAVCPYCGELVDAHDPERVRVLYFIGFLNDWSTWEQWFVLEGTFLGPNGPWLHILVFSGLNGIFVEEWQHMRCYTILHGDVVGDGPLGGHDGASWSGA